MVLQEFFVELGCCPIPVFLEANSVLHFSLVSLENAVLQSVSSKDVDRSVAPQFFSQRM